LEISHIITIVKVSIRESGSSSAQTIKCQTQKHFEILTDKFTKNLLIQLCGKYVTLAMQPRFSN
jgi:hypothetical protein